VTVELYFQHTRSMFKPPARAQQAPA
jgi:hypothetical protein